MGILQQIRQDYGNFSKTNKKIADLILRQPTYLLNHTAQEFAILSGTSPSSVVRFSQKLGYSGIEELKINIAGEQGNWGKSSEIDPIVSKDDSISKLAGKVELLINQTMADLMAILDEKRLSEAIEYIKQAETVYLLGIGASSLSAYNLYHKLNRAGKKTMYSFDAHMNIEFINYATAKDVVIAFSYSGKTQEVLVPCKKAKELRCPTILVTKNNDEVLAEVTSTILLVPNNEHVIRIGAISSVNASMAVADILYLGSIQDKMDGLIQDRMIETNQLVNQLKEN